MFIFGLLIFTIAFAYLAYRKTEWALLALVFLLPTYLIRFNVGIPMTLLEVMILVTFAVWLCLNRSWLLARFRKMEKGASMPRSAQYPFAAPLIAWLVVSLIAVAVSGFGLSAFGIWRAYFFEPALLYIVAVNVITTRERVVRVIAAFGVSAAVMAVFALYQYLTGDFISNPLWASEAGRRAVSFFEYPNAVGLFAGPITLLLVGVFAMLVVRGKTLFEKRRHVAVWLIGIILCLVAIYCARSEGAMLGVMAGLLVFGLCANKRLRLITIALVIVGGIGLSVSASARSYAFDTILLHSFSGQVRRAQWQETWKMLKDGRIIFGAGLNNYQKTIAPYHTDGIFVRDYRDPDFQRKVVFNTAFRAKVWQPLEIYMYPHNILLNFWTETGLPGVAVFVWIVIAFMYFGIRSFRAACHNRDPFAYAILGVMAALVVWLVHGLVDVPYFKNDLAAMFWVLMALMSSIYILSQRSGEPLSETSST